MFALADYNNFYASCQQLFKPEYDGVPVIVWINNDGCVIARSSGAKACGIAMGAPFFKIREEIKKHTIAMFGSHHTLYGGISAKAMDNLVRFYSWHFNKQSVLKIDQFPQNLRYRKLSPAHKLIGCAVINGQFIAINDMAIGKYHLTKKTM